MGFHKDQFWDQCFLQFLEFTDFGVMSGQVEHNIKLFTDDIKLYCIGVACLPQPSSRYEYPGELVSLVATSM